MGVFMANCWNLSSRVSQHKTRLSNGLTGHTGQNTGFLSVQNPE
jgi:hypothetical protein